MFKNTLLTFLPPNDQSRLKLDPSSPAMLSILHDLHAILPTPTFAAHREPYLGIPRPISLHIGVLSLTNSKTLQVTPVN